MWNVYFFQYLYIQYYILCFSKLSNWFLLVAKATFQIVDVSLFFYVMLIYARFVSVTEREF